MAHIKIVNYLPIDCYHRRLSFYVGSTPQSPSLVGAAHRFVGKKRNKKNQVTLTHSHKCPLVHSFGDCHSRIVSSAFALSYELSSAPIPLAPCCPSLLYLNSSLSCYPW